MIDLDNLDKYSVRSDRYSIVTLSKCRAGDYYAILRHKDDAMSIFVIKIDQAGNSDNSRCYDIIEKPVIKYMNLTKGGTWYEYVSELLAIERANNSETGRYVAIAVPVPVGLNLYKIRGK